MLASANAFAPTISLETLAARARNARRNFHLTAASALTKRLFIGSLRATAGAPGVQPATADKEQHRSPLVTPAKNGKGLLSRLQGQADLVSPLTAGIGRADPSGKRSLGMLQGQTAGMRQIFTRLDQRSRYLQATSGSARGATGFAARLFHSTLDARA
jgi:hypothetical protein